jgi:hypothetical protein
MYLPISNASDLIHTIVSDMELPHEGQPQGVPNYYSWAFGPEIVMGNNPNNFSAITAWGQIYADVAGNSAQNTRVQIRNIKTLILSQATGSWAVVQSSTAVEGAAYREDYADNVSIPPDVRYAADGSVSVKLTPGYNYHFWPTGGRGTIDADDVAGVFTTAEARLIVNDLTLPDDRDQARILMSVGGDYWLNTTSSWDYFETHGAIGTGRFRYIGTEWNSFNMTTLTRDEIYSNPPPMRETLFFEAEQATEITNYRIENVGVASGGKTLSFVGGLSAETGSATFKFDEMVGTYDIVVGGFDDNDGLAYFTVQINDFETETTAKIGSLRFDANLGSSIANAKTKISATVALGVELTPGDSITVNGLENLGDHARLDFLKLVPTN